MARIRSIKPEIRTSEKVNSWPIEVRYFWIMLWGYVDDFGRGRDNVKLIVADTYPLDDDVTHKDVERWLKILERDKVIYRYTVDGKPYLLIQNWSEHQRPSHPARSVIPKPEPTPDKGQEDSGNPPEELSKITVDGSPEQGAESSEQGAVDHGETSPKTTINEDFEKAWTEYPVKKERKRALAAYKKALDDVTPETILMGIQKYKADPKRDPNFTKHFSTWLNAGCWEDDYSPIQITGDTAPVPNQYRMFN